MTRSLWLILSAAMFVSLGVAQTSQIALERYIEDSMRVIERNPPTAGSLFAVNSLLAEPARDPRAARVGDLITIIVSEEASALSSGNLTQSRESDTDSSISRLLGVVAPTAGLANLFRHSTTSDLTGTGSTSRRTNVSATLTAHVSHVMPNGNLVIEGAKEISVNAERQLVWLRGVVRQADLNPDNSVGSERVAMMDLRVNGKGVVNAAIRRPNIVYRIFRGLLPF